MYFSDLLDSFCSYKKWLYLSYYDIYKRYRRSKLGQVWIVLSTIVLTLSISLIYSKLFGLNFLDYFIFLVQSLCLWIFIKETIQDSLNVFYQNKIFLLNEKWNHLIMIFRVLLRNIIIYGHNLIIIIILNIFFSKEFSSFGLLIFFLNFFLIIPFLFSVCLIGSIFVTRFRDLEIIISNFLQLLFFITPILYKKTFLGSYDWIVDYNIIAIIMHFVNCPLTLEFPSFVTYVIIFTISAIFITFSAVLYNLKKKRINYWL